MKTPTNPLGIARRRFARLLLVCGSVALVGSAAPTAVAQPAVTAITLERGCFGCPGSLLVLRRDGSATLTVTGNARSGTSDKTSNGTVPAADFDALARLAVAHGFFQLGDIYEDAETRDGPWATITIARGAGDKRVFIRDAAAPAAFQTIEAAIDALKTKIKFVAQP